MDGVWWVLFLFAMVYSWMLFNGAALIAHRFKRFSMRSLLIAMTIVAAALGAVAWMRESGFLLQFEHGP